MTDELASRRLQKQREAILDKVMRWRWAGWVSVAILVGLVLAAGVLITVAGMYLVQWIVDNNWRLVATAIVASALVVVWARLAQREIVVTWPDDDELE